MDQVNQLIEENIMLIYYVIHRLKLKVDDDLVSEGKVALVKAAKSYNPEKGVKFCTYATKAIKGYILTYINSKRPLIKPMRDKNNYIQAPVVDIDDEVLMEIAGTEEAMDSQIFVDEFIDSLEEREKVVVEGLLQYKTQAEIGKDLSLSQVQVYRIINVVRGKLRTYMENS